MKFSTETVLPAACEAVRVLHDHRTMITLNPLVVDFRQLRPDEIPQESPDERPAEAKDAKDETWYELTDAVPWVGRVKYTACFRDSPTGLHTRVIAPAGLRIQTTWTVSEAEGDSSKSLKEDVDMQCSFIMAWFVRRTLDRAHAVLVQRMTEQKFD